MHPKSVRPGFFFSTQFMRQLLVAVLASLACAGVFAQTCDGVSAITVMTRNAIVSPGPGLEPATTSEQVAVPDRIPLGLRNERVRLVYQFNVDDCARSGASLRSLSTFRPKLSFT